MGPIPPISDLPAPIFTLSIAHRISILFFCVFCLFFVCFSKIICLFLSVFRLFWQNRPFFFIFPLFPAFSAFFFFFDPLESLLNRNLGQKKKKKKIPPYCGFPAFSRKASQKLETRPSQPLRMGPKWTRSSQIQPRAATARCQSCPKSNREHPNRALPTSTSTLFLLNSTDLQWEQE